MLRFRYLFLQENTQGTPEKWIPKLNLSQISIHNTVLLNTITQGPTNNIAN